MFMWAARTGANTPGILQGGLASATDCQVTAPVSGLSVNVSTGEMLIPGNEGGTQGAGYARVSSTTNAAVSTANASNPRIDRIVALMSDAGYTEPTGGSGSQWAVSVVTGTPTAGATLVNLSGAAAVPGSSLLLANLLVPATATNIITADIANKATLVNSVLANNYLQLIQPNVVAVNTGSTAIVFSASTQATPLNVSHGLGRQPIFVGLTPAIGATATLVAMNVGAASTTTFTAEATASASLSTSITFEWVAIG